MASQRIKEFFKLIWIQSSQPHKAEVHEDFTKRPIAKVARTIGGLSQFSVIAGGFFFAGAPAITALCVGGEIASISFGIGTMNGYINKKIDENHQNKM